jgi:hypothetical protein
LERNLQDLHAQPVSKRHRRQSIRRVHVPKAPGRTRPIGISAFEDGQVPDALREVMEAVTVTDGDESVAP